MREYEMVKQDKAKGIQFRRLDAILILRRSDELDGRDEWIDKNPEAYLENRGGLTDKNEVEFIQAKCLPLGMGLMGQTLFSRSLMNDKLRERRWKPKSRRWIALCKQIDTRLGDLMADYGIDVIVPKGKGFVVGN